MNTAAVAGAAISSKAVASPNDTVRVACVGLRGRGGNHIDSYSKLPNVELVALCDIDESVLNKRAGQVEAGGKKKPALYTDYRKLLEDKSIDAVSIATPNHHHTLQTIWGVQAGKDVYVEKPCSHTLFEAQQIVAATRKYDRLVQHGSQSRSSSALQEAVQKMREGELGEVYMARALCYKWRDTIGKEPVSAVPAGVHYDMWIGPAPAKPFTKNRFHYNWHWQWDYGNGDLGNQGIHEMDIARWGLGVKYPTKVHSMGGHYMFDDDQETPNTMTTTFEFDVNGKKKLLVFDLRHWMSNHEAGIGEGKNTRKDPNTIGNTFYGSKGYLAIDGYSKYQTWMGKDQQPGSAKSQGGDHFANFINAVRSRKRGELNAEIEEGAASTVLVHLANISYRLGRSINFDPAKMVCPNDAEANKMFTKVYRAGWEVKKFA